MRRRRRVLAALVACLAAVTVTACGSDDYENEPRPPTPFEVSIQVTDQDLVVAPSEFGAGIANITVVNLGEISTAVEIDGPTVDASDEIAPGNSAVIKMETEPGDYEATAPETDAEPFAFRVGPERESGNDELLLP